MSRKVTSLWVVAAVLLFTIPVTAQNAVKKAAVKKFSAHKLLTNSQAEKVKKHTLKMTDREWEIFQNNGGTKNLRRYINLGKFRKII